jgi:PAS domain S-box-containing protein
MLTTGTREENTVESSTETYSGIACDRTGTVTSYGIGAEKIFGWKPEEVVGKQSVTIFHLPEAVAELVPRLLKTAAETGKFEEEVFLVKKDGTKFNALLTVRPVKKNNEIVGYMGITKPL